MSAASASDGSRRMGRKESFWIFLVLVLGFEGRVLGLGLSSFTRCSLIAKFQLRIVSVSSAV